MVGQRIWRPLSTLLWGLLHLPTVLRRAIAGVYAAEEARSRMTQLEQVAETRMLHSLDLIENLARQNIIIFSKLDEMDSYFDATMVRRLDAIKSELVDQLDTTKSDLVSRLDATRSDLVSQLNATNSDLLGQLDATRSDLVRRLDAAQSALVNQLNATKSDMVGQLGVTRSDLAGRLDADKSSLVSLTEKLGIARREIMFQQRRLTQLTVPSPSPPLRPAAPMISAQRHDSLYAAFEDVFRGSREDIARRLKPYAERLFSLMSTPSQDVSKPPFLTNNDKIDFVELSKRIAADAGQSDKPIVDIGCGRGEWLELLGKKGLSSYGIDINSVMVERSVALGLDARHADMLQHLCGLKDASRSAVTAFHVVGRLALDTLVDFLDEALRVLASGGVLILGAQRPATVRVEATTLDYDPTHRNSLAEPSLKFIVEHRGFIDVEVFKPFPLTQELLQADTNDTEMPSRVLSDPLDYAIIARRP